MAHQGTPQVAGPAAASQPAKFVSLLSEEPPRPDPPDAQDQDFLADLRLDQVIEAVAGQRDERDLIAGLLRRRVRDAGTIEYRHEVFADLEDRQLYDATAEFCRQMHRVRTHLRLLADM